MGCSWSIARVIVWIVVGLVLALSLRQNVRLISSVIRRANAGSKTEDDISSCGH
jgi:hypothetical protein